MELFIVSILLFVSLSALSVVSFLLLKTCRRMRDAEEDLQNHGLIFGLVQLDYLICDAHGDVLIPPRDSSNWRQWPDRKLAPEKWLVPEDLPMFQHQLADLFAGHRRFAKLTYRVSDDGRTRYFITHAISLPQQKGCGSRVFAAIQDITLLRECEKRNADVSQALIDKQNTWNVVINSTPVLFFVKDMDNDGRYVICNRAYANFVGKEPNEIIGKTDVDIFPDDAAKMFRNNDLMFLSHPEQHTTEEHAVSKTGAMFCFSTKRSAYLSVDGRRFIIVAANDITAVHNLLANEQTLNCGMNAILSEENPSTAMEAVLRMLCKNLKSSRTYIMKFDAEKNLWTPNWEFVATVGGKALLGVDSLRLDDTMMRQLSAGEKFFIGTDVDENDVAMYGLSRLTDNGVMPHSLFVIGIVIENKLWGCLGFTFEDALHSFTTSEIDFLLSATKMIELMILRSAFQTNLVDALEKAKAAAKAKSFFITSISHEIRTPLNAVIGLASLLKAPDIDPAMRADYIESIFYSGNALLQLINDVLDLSRLEANKMNLVLEPTDFSTLVDEIIKVFYFLASDKKISLHSEISQMPRLQLDKLRIRQILFNLVGNAVKFTPPNGSVIVRADYNMRSDSCGVLTFSVVDTGIGISDEDQKKLMEPFVQLSTMRETNAGRNGTGLGLAISKRLAERMNGKLFMSSELGKGSTFSVSIAVESVCNDFVQLQSSNQPAPKLPAISADQMNDMSILLVDDVQLNLKVLDAICRKAGITKIVCASSGRVALQMLHERHFDIVFTDLWMPEMNGAELVSLIRKIPQLENLPVFAVTADIELKDNFPIENFNGVLIKPISLERVLAAIKAIQR